MSLQVINVILILGTAQGIFLSMLIFHKHGKLFANRILGTLILLYSVFVFDLWVSKTGNYIFLPHLMLLPAGLPFIFGPLHYLYARSLIQPARRFVKKDWLHFIPLLLYKIFLLPDF